ncbi:MAG: NAD(P)-dependent oxidoreductase [Oscillospiraceae bacterium]|nr:NAD(P)-dependent oxidoreductase [Oscillospiraceae bacterium]
MKVFAYSCRPYDEKAAFETAAAALGIEFACTSAPPTLENAALAAGSQYLSITTTPVAGALMERFCDLGIRMISTRTIGFDHVNLVDAKRLGVQVSNVTYTPDAVADYTVMMMLMALRKVKRILQRADSNDFTLKGLLGGLLGSRTVGVIGTGRIGQAVIRDLQGFGCKIYAYDKYPRRDAGIDYLPLPELLRRCDLITLHAPLAPEDVHMIGRAQLALLPDGAVVVNTARGGLIDTAALIEALEAGKVGACALDVIEDEFDLYYYDRRADIVGNHALSILRDMPNAVVTPHMAFYTDQSVADMCRNSLLSCQWHDRGQENPYRIG